MKSDSSGIATAPARGQLRPAGAVLAGFANRAMPHFPAAVGYFLLAAALGKAHSLATDSVVGTGFWNSRTFLTILVLIELAFGLWLILGFYPSWTRVAAIGAFFAFTEFNFFLVLRGEPCPCLGGLRTAPWVMLLVDLGILFGLLAWQPSGPDGERPWPVRRGLGFFLILYGMVAVPSWWTMSDYSHEGFALELRADTRLQAKAELDLKNPSSEDVLARLGSASGLTLTMDERLLAQPPEYGRIGPTTVYVWSAMMLVATKQRRPSRWAHTAAGYRLRPVGVLGGRSTVWMVSAVVMVVLLAALKFREMRGRREVVAARAARLAHVRTPEL